MTSQNLPTEKSFGLLFSVIALVLGLYGLYRGWTGYLVAAIFSTCLALALATVFYPSLLVPLNKAWFLLGQMLGRVVSPAVLAVLYYGLLTPIAIITRAFGRDELRLKRRPAESYWLPRDPPGPKSTSFKNQF